MKAFLDSGNLRVAVYLAVAALAALWGVRERRWNATRRPDWWPTYWFMSAVLLATMGIARAGELGDLLGELGRDQVRNSSWYDTRRTLQAAAVIIVTVVWLVGVVVAIWRVPPRRRRYLPHVIAMSSLIAFAAVRVVSLHHIDTLLYRRDVAGVRVVAIVELSMLLVTALVTAGTRGFPDPSPVASENDRDKPVASSA